MELMNIDDAAKYLGVKTETIYGWIYRKEIGFKRIGKKAVRFTKEDLEAMITSHTPAPAEIRPTRKIGRPKKNGAAGMNVDAIVEQAKRECLS